MKVKTLLSYLFLVVKSFAKQSSGIPFLFRSGDLSNFHAYRQSQVRTLGFLTRAGHREPLEGTPPPHGSHAAQRLFDSVFVGNKRAKLWKKFTAFKQSHRIN